MLTFRRFVVSSCCVAGLAFAQTKTPAAPASAAPPSAADSFLQKCRGDLSRVKTALSTLEKSTGARTVENTLEPLNRIAIDVAGTYERASLYAEVHPDEAVQEASRTCAQEASDLNTSISLNRPLYDLLAQLKTDEPETRRVLERTLRDFRRAGVDKDEATRKRLTAIEDELTKVGQTFSANIGKDTRSLKLDGPVGLAGLPPDFIAAHPAGADGKITITTDYPDSIPFMKYAKDDALKKQLYVLNRSRGDKENSPLLLQVLTLRAEKAKLLGYANWADYVTEDKMIRSGKAAGDFIDRVAGLAKKRADRDYAELLQELKTVDPKATRVEDWQKSFLEERVKQKKYAVDSREVRPYFPFAQTLQGLLALTGELYELTYVPVTDGQPWHPDVKVYDVQRAGKKLGRIYLDMHPRPNKYKHAAQFPLVDGVAGVQLPEGALVCNFPAGDELLEHEDVVTMFHEFGHLMHHVLAGQQHWVRNSGVATELDFAEAPSQMFEEWAWNHQSLARFAKRADGKVISPQLVDKLRRADTFGVGLMAEQQMFYAAVSLQFHQADPATLQLLPLVKSLQEKYTPYRFVEGTSFHNSFGHLIDYSAMYYTYMWSLVIAKDLLSPFLKKGLLDHELSHKYRDVVLARGGSQDASVLVHDFLGRDYEFKAFEAYLAGK